MEVYGFPTFNLTKVLLAAEEVDQPYQLHILNPTKGEHKTPDHLLRHPLGKIPAVSLDNEYFFESGSIVRLLAERSDSNLYGQSAKENARINQWMDLLANHIGQFIGTFYWEEVIKPNLLKEPTDLNKLKEAQGLLNQQLPVLEQKLSLNPYVAGERFTLADVIGFSYFETVPYLSLELQNYSSVLSWVGRICERPSYQSMMKKLQSRSMTECLMKLF